jgi:hypothetical protein
VACPNSPTPMAHERGHPPSAQGGAGERVFLRGLSPEVGRWSSARQHAAAQPQRRWSQHADAALCTAPSRARECRVVTGRCCVPVSHFFHPSPPPPSPLTPVVAPPSLSPPSSPHRRLTPSYGYLLHSGPCGRPHHTDTLIQFGFV